MTPSEFKIRFAEFAAEEDTRIELFIGVADPFFDADRWGGLYAEGVANFVAGKLAAANAAALLADGSGDTNSGIISKKVGDIQIGYSEAVLLAKMKDPFLGTTYGAEYMRLARLVGIGAVAV